MGLLHSIKDAAAAAFAPVTGGISLLSLDENTRSRIPLLGELTGARSDAEKQLLAKQQQMAQEAKVRMGQQQDARMTGLAQQLLAFNPRNQMLAQMFGPQAAFTPQQIGQMTQGPAPQTDLIGKYDANNQPLQPEAQQEQRRRLGEYQAAEQRRQDLINGNFQAPGPGPAPIAMPQAQRARRY